MADDTSTQADVRQARAESSTKRVIPPDSLEEYKALREEILTRYEIRGQYMQMTVLSTAAIWSAAFQFPRVTPVLLVYPLLVLFLALGWASHAFITQQTGAYIREHLEQPHSGLQWETYVYGRKSGSIGWLLYGTISAGGIFLVTEIVSLGLAFQRTDVQGADWVLFSVGLVSMLLTIGVFGHVLVQRVRDDDVPRLISGIAARFTARRSESSSSDITTHAS